MAKGKQAGAAAPPQPTFAQVPNKDLALRLHFMHQAATFLHLSQLAASAASPGSAPPTGLALPPGGPSSNAVKEGRVAKRKRNRKGKARREEKEDGDAGSLTRLACGIAQGIKGISVHNKAKL